MGIDFVSGMELGRIGTGGINWGRRVRERIWGETPGIEGHLGDDVEN